MTDLVFIDAPGTGFSRIAGKDKEKAFYGVDQDAYAFAEFISQFLSKYGRWNSPKYLFGESYGTPRSAVLINQLESDRSIDFNGVILLSQILNFDLSPGSADRQSRCRSALPDGACPPMPRPPGITRNCPAISMRISKPSSRKSNSSPWGTTGVRWRRDPSLSPAERSAIAEKLHQYTGLSVEYILKADLRIDGGEFRQTLQGDAGLTTGRLDTRFSGPDHRSSERSALTMTRNPPPWARRTCRRSTSMLRKDLRYGDGKDLQAQHLRPLEPGIFSTSSRARISR